MKILVVGVFDVENSANIFAAKALRALGHTVEEFSYRAISRKIGITAMNAGLVYEVNKTSPDLVLIFKGNELAVPAVQQISKLTNVWYFFMDPISTAAPHFINLAKECTYVSCTGGGVAKYFEANGCADVHLVFDGVDPEYYHPVSLNPEFAADVSFVGSRTQERMDYIYHLGATRLVRVYGDGFGSRVLGGVFNTICGSSQAVLSINTQNDVADYWSDRLVISLACGAFVLQKYSPGLEKWFKNKEQLVWFNTKEELVELANYYLAAERFEERRSIAQAGYDHVLANYTWRHQMQKLLEYIK